MGKTFFIFILFVFMLVLIGNILGLTGCNANESEKNNV